MLHSRDFMLTTLPYLVQITSLYQPLSTIMKPGEDVESSTGRGRCCNDKTNSRIGKARSRSAPGALQPGVTTPMRYSPIKPWQMRLLRLSHGSKSALLQGELLHATVSLVAGSPCAILDTGHHVTYSALSYTWGDQHLDGKLCKVLERGTKRKEINFYDEACTIQLSGSPFHITSSLKTALHELRQEACPVLLWIDAVCINQKDPAERSMQVSNMLDIFRGASRVNVWLGEATEKFDLALEFIASLTTLLENDEFKMLWEAAPDRQAAAEVLARLNALHAAVCSIFPQASGLTDSSHGRSVYKSLLDFYSQPWLYRTWIRQEVYAAKEIIVMCGSHRIPWKSFVGAHKAIELFYQQSSNGIVVLKPPTSELASLGAELKACTSMDERQPYKDFVEVLVASKHLRATDERDKVFAVLGMCGIRAMATKTLGLSRYNPTLTVDYTKTVAQVWHDVSIYLMRRPKHVTATKVNFPWADVFNFAARRQDSTHELPSWVMDWPTSCGLSDMTTLVNWRINQPWGEYLHLYPLDGPWSGQHDWKTPVRRTDSALTIPKCHFLSVITSLTPYTCDLQDFLRLPRIYSTRNEDDIYGGNSPFHRFDETTHCRRAAWIAGRAKKSVFFRKHYQQLVMVPCTAKAGDIIVASTPGVLPLVLSFKDTPSLGQMLLRMATLERRRNRLYCVRELQQYDGSYEFCGPVIALWDAEKVSEDMLGKSHLLDIILA